MEDLVLWKYLLVVNIPIIFLSIIMFIQFLTWRRLNQKGKWWVMALFGILLPYECLLVHMFIDSPIGLAVVWGLFELGAWGMQIFIGVNIIESFEKTKK